MEKHQIQVKTYDGKEVDGSVFMTSDGVLKTLIKDAKGSSSWQVLDPNEKNIVSRIIQLPIISRAGSTQKVIHVDMKTLFVSLFPDIDIPDSITNMQKYMGLPPKK